MVGQCANPLCPAIFRSLHIGKLFVFPPGVCSTSGEEPKLTHVWLCEVCNRSITVTLKDGQLLRLT